MSLHSLNVNCAFCGGTQCKYCGNPAHWKDANAIAGLYSSWILQGRVLAMQRPTAELMDRHDHVAAFTAAGLRCIINLQVLDEHRNCGPGNLPNIGLSYDPEVWMRSGFSYFNLGWADMDTPSFEIALTIARVMATEILMNRGVAVHCHAGLGRTGLAISCYLIYDLDFSATKAIEHVRQHRPGSVQNSKQVKFIKYFAEKLVQMRAAICGHHLQCEQHTLHELIDFQKTYFIEEDQRLPLPKVLLQGLAVVKHKIPREHKWTISANLLKSSKMDLSHGLGKLFDSLTVKSIEKEFEQIAPVNALEFCVYFLLYFVKEPAVRLASFISQALNDKSPGLNRQEISIIRELVAAFELTEMDWDVSSSSHEYEAFSTVVYLLTHRNLNSVENSESTIPALQKLIKTLSAQDFDAASPLKRNKQTKSPVSDGGASKSPSSPVRKIDLPLQGNSPF